MGMKFNWLRHKDVLKEMIELRKKGMTYVNIQTYLADVRGVYATTDMIRSAYNRHSPYYPGFIDDKKKIGFLKNESKKQEKSPSLIQKAMKELSKGSMSKREQVLTLLVVLLLMDDENE